MDVDFITQNIEELFSNACYFEDMREYYYMIRSTLDNSFREAVKNNIRNDNNEM